MQHHLPFDPEVVEDIYMVDIRGSKYVMVCYFVVVFFKLNVIFSFAIRRIMILEFSQYLENYLWPNYKPGASHSHIMSIVVMLNEKFREHVQVWQVSVKKILLHL